MKHQALPHLTSLEGLNLSDPEQSPYPAVPTAACSLRSIAALRSAGIAVDILGEGSLLDPQDEAHERAARDACLRVNEPLLHRAALRCGNVVWQGC